MPLRSPRCGRRGPAVSPEAMLDFSGPIVRSAGCVLLIDALDAL
jgi:hypothetical protein